MTRSQVRRQERHTEVRRRYSFSRVVHVPRTTILSQSWSSISLERISHGTREPVSVSNTFSGGNPQDGKCMSTYRATDGCEELLRRRRGACVSTSAKRALRRARLSLPPSKLISCSCLFGRRKREETLGRHHDKTWPPLGGRQQLLGLLRLWFHLLARLLSSVWAGGLGGSLLLLLRSKPAQVRHR